MRPAFSVIFLTTLIGAGQGLFLALFICESMATQSSSADFLIGGSAIVLLLSSLGLIASFFHLGHPERAWRSAAMWRTSWLSREVIALPAFMGLVFAYGIAHWANLNFTVAIGTAATVTSLALFICTGMIYAAIKVLKEWAHPLTLINFALQGSASGTTLAAAYASFAAPSLASPLALAALVLTVMALVMRAASLIRNAKLRPSTTLQTAIGVRHPRIVQKSQGAMGGSFNTREFFHGKSDSFLVTVKIIFLLLAFVIPVLLLLVYLSYPSALLPSIAFLAQYVGLLAERWYFFAEANHPQNLYYQGVS